MAPRAPAYPVADPLVTPDELAGELKIKVNTLYSWRTRGQGPAGFMVGGALRWRRSEIARWLAESGDTAATGKR